MPKQDCKYWDKCYQRNEEHLNKYNHPAKVDEEKSPPKRKASTDHQQVMEKTSDHHEDKSTSTTTATGEFEAETAELHKEAMNNIAGKNYMEIFQKRVRLSVQQEYDNLCQSNEFIRHKFLVEMPPDFYQFWTFLNSLKKDTTNADLLKYIEKTYQLKLVGPFEFLAGCFHKAKIAEPGNYLRHWRFYYDPPEFQTVFVKRNTGIHYGYWRDVPQDKENLLLARNDMTQGCEFQFVAGNIFDAFLYFLEHDFAGTPFTAALEASTKKAVPKYISDNNLEFGTLSHLQQERNKSVMAKTFHRAGIVVPFDRKSHQGYRPLMVSDAELKKMLALFDRNDVDNASAKQAVLEKLQPVANAANIAVDECDFGTALELGIDLFCSGHKELHMLVTSLLMPAYGLLHRPQFVAIAKAHMDNRSRELKLSMLDNLEAPV